VSGLGADPVHDQVLRDAGEAVASIVIELVDDQEAMPSLMRHIATGELAVTTIKLNTKNLQRPGLALPDNIQFDLVFLPQLDESLASFGVAPVGQPPLERVRASEAFMFLNVLPPGASALATAMPRQLFGSIVQSLRSRPDIILHEATHMLDHFRGKEFFVNLAPPWIGETPGSDEYVRKYINNPVEFNAHFQEGIFSLRETLKDYSTPIEVRTALANFKNFQEAAMRSRGLNVLLHATRGKWRRKLMSRLYQTWQHWREEGL
jgi:hypothetical protein